ARRVEGVRCCNPAEISGIGWNSGAVKCCNDVIRHSEQWSVADVESLRSELQFRRFGDPEVLENGYVHSLVGGHVEYVVPFIPGRAERLPPELADVDPLINAFRERLRRNQTWAILRDADGILLGSPVKYCERLARPVGVDGVNLPALDNL